MIEIRIHWNFLHQPSFYATRKRQNFFMKINEKFIRTKKSTKFDFTSEKCLNYSSHKFLSFSFQWNCVHFQCLPKFERNCWKSNTKSFARQLGWVSLTNELFDLGSGWASNFVDDFVATESQRARLKLPNSDKWIIWHREEFSDE